MEDEDAWKLVLPAEKREYALLESHAEPTAGHLGRAKTLARLSLYYTGPQKKNCRFWDGDYTFLLYFFPLNPNPASKVGG